MTEKRGKGNILAADAIRLVVVAVVVVAVLSVQLSPNDDVQCARASSGRSSLMALQLQMTWQPSLLSQKRKSGPPLGLRNLGNSCYLNSVLQCLTYTPPLANFCLRNQHSSLCTYQFRHTYFKFLIFSFWVLRYLP